MCERPSASGVLRASCPPPSLPKAQAQSRAEEDLASCSVSRADCPHGSGEPSLLCCPSLPILLPCVTIFFFKQESYFLPSTRQGEGAPPYSPTPPSPLARASLRGLPLRRQLPTFSWTLLGFCQTLKCALSPFPIYGHPVALQENGNH